mgnify:CR=1 FL=1
MPSMMGQVGAIVAGAVAGRWALRFGHLPAAEHRDFGVSRRTGAALLLLFGLLLVLLPILAFVVRSPALSVVASFYQSGALVFGGGHVVLPLLQASVVPHGLVSNEAFLAGYGATQAVPGPLFTFAAYLGAVMTGPMGGWLGGLTLLGAIFAPALLLVAGALPFWESLRQRDGVRRAMAGANAAVVGVLAAALYDPLWTTAIHSLADLGLALAAFGFGFSVLTRFASLDVRGFIRSFVIAFLLAVFSIRALRSSAVVVTAITAAATAALATFAAAITICGVLTFGARCACRALITLFHFFFGVVIVLDDVVLFFRFDNRFEAGDEFRTWPA